MKDTLALEVQLFLLAMRRLSRLPVPQHLPASDDLAVRAAKFYPVVGLVIGTIAASVLLVFSPWLPPVAAVLVALAAGLLVTGAFHESGLAAAAEAFGTTASRDAAFEALRAPGIGVVGAVTLGVVLALKVALLASVSAQMAAVLLIAAHCLSRAAMVQVIATTPHARDELSRFAPMRATPDGVRIALATGLIALCGLVLAGGPGAGLLALTGGIVGVAVVRHFSLNRLGGHTGACLGATQQMAELGIYLGAVAWL